MVNIASGRVKRRACGRTVIVWSTLVTGSKLQVAYDFVRRRIVDGTYASGHRIVLPRVAAEIGTSTAPVREALRRLEAEGLVEFTRWAGARVAGFDERQLGEAIAAAAMLEAEIALLAARSSRTPTWPTMREANEPLLRAAASAGDLSAARDADRAFHAVMHRRCPNRMLVTLVQIAYTRMDTVHNIYEHRPERITQRRRRPRSPVELLGGDARSEEVALAFRRHGLRAAAEIAGREAGASSVTLSRIRSEARGRTIPPPPPEESAVLKIVWFVKRAEHLSREEFERWWLETHVPVARAAPGLRRYVVNLAQPDDLAGKPATEPDWDGVAEQWFDDEEALNAAYSRPVAGDIRADSLAHMSQLERLIVREIDIEPRPDAAHG